MGLLAVPQALLVKAGVKNPNNAKLIVYGAVAVLGVIGIIIIRKQVKKLFGNYVAPVDKHPVVGSATITKDDAKSIADRLWNNLTHNLIVTFSSLMTDVPNPDSLNKADKAMVYNAFGKRSTGFPFYTEGDLNFWLDRKIKFGVINAKEFWAY